MKKLLMGQVNGKNLYCDVDSFVASNSLVTGMTRSGKSYKMRTMFETLCRVMPVWIIDPEVEFYTLREKFPFLLFGEGGEAPLAVNTARALARNLLRWKVSAVLSVGNLPEMEQHDWVAAFLNELMNRPRAEWIQAAVGVDESQLFAPNSGQGRSEALIESRNLARRGLKRGLIPVWATQRLSSLSVAVSSSSGNLLVGKTTRTADQQEAVKLLGVAKNQQAEFIAKLRKCKRGEFFAVGPAYSEDIITLVTPEVKTTHFSGKIGEEPAVMPTPRSLRYLLPEIDAMVEAVRAEEQEVETDKKTIERLKKAMAADGIIEREMPGEREQQLTAAVEVAEADRQKVQERLDAVMVQLGMSVEQSEKLYRQLSATVAGLTVAEGDTLTQNPYNLTPQAERILTALREVEGLGIDMVRRAWPSLLTGSSLNSGTVNEILSHMKRLKLIHVPQVYYLALTPAGRQAVPAPDRPLQRDVLIGRVQAAMGEDMFKIFDTLLHLRGLWVERGKLRDKAGFTRGSYKFPKLIARMHAAGLVELGKNPAGTVRLEAKLLELVGKAVQ